MADRSADTWYPTAAYLYVLHLDGPALAWEYLRRLARREGAVMTILSTTTNTTGTVPHPRSRLNARLALAGLAACGFAALAWASFVSPLPRLTCNPSDSVAVGWYRIDRLDHRTGSLSRLLSVNSIVLVPLPPKAATLAAQRGYMPATSC